MRPAPRPKPRNDMAGVLAALAVAGGAALLAAGVSLALDAVLAARLRAALAAAPPLAPGGTVTLRDRGRWECRALTGGLWMVPLRPQLALLPLPDGTVAIPARGRCGGAGLAPVVLTLPG